MTRPLWPPMEKARADYPGVWDLISFEAELLRENRGPAAALPLVQEFSATIGGISSASLALGRLFSEIGDVVQAGGGVSTRQLARCARCGSAQSVALLSVRQNQLEDALQTQPAPSPASPTNRVHISCSPIFW